MVDPVGHTTCVLWNDSTTWEGGAAENHICAENHMCCGRDPRTQQSRSCVWDPKHRLGVSGDGRE